MLGVYIYIYIKDRQAEQQSDFFLPIIFSSFSYKNLFLRARSFVFRRFGDLFAAHDQNQRVVVSWERSAIIFFYPCIEGVFSLRIVFARFNPDWLFLPLLYFSLCLLYDIVHCWFMSCQLKLFSYLIQDLAFSSYLFILFYFNFLTIWRTKKK